MKTTSFLCVALLLVCACSDPDPKSGNNNPNNINNLNNVNNQNNLNNGGSNNTNGVNTTNNNGDEPCPVDQPSSGNCPVEGIVCEYGDDPRDGCNTIATCEGGEWSVSGVTCDEIPVGEACPPALNEADGEDCDPEDAYCSYGDLDCHCTPCDDTGPVVMCDEVATWHCEVPNPDGECPEGKVAYGTACSIDGKTCDYKCGPDGGLVCESGVWQPADGGPCPMSTKDVKRDIRYLDDKELQKIAGQLQSLRLANYEYTRDGLPLGPQLGIIIEDAPGSYAVNERARMVDLYGFTSMLLADAQEKERRIKKLEATVERLEKKLK